jgi:hypothetical protein
VTEPEELTDAEKVTDTDQAKGADQDQTAATVPTSKPAKQADRFATHRPALRGPLGAFGQRSRGLLHSGDADAPTPGARAVGDGSGTVGPSSTRGPSDGDSEGKGSAGSDADGA